MAQFPPFGPGNNVSSYLQWAIPISGIAVSPTICVEASRLTYLPKVNGTQFTPTSTYASIGLTRSLALFDMYV